MKNFNLIPGINMIPKDQLKEFFNTKEGEVLAAILAPRDEPILSSDSFSQRSCRTRKNNEIIQNNLKQTKTLLPLNLLIHKAMLNEFIMGFSFLDEALQKTLIEKNFTARFYDAYWIQKASLEPCIEAWMQSFKDDEDTQAIWLQFKQRRDAFGRHLKRQFGFLLEKNTPESLLLNMGKDLYDSDKNKEEKIKLLENKFETYLAQYPQYQTKEIFPDFSSSMTYLVNMVLGGSQEDLIKVKEYGDRIADVHMAFQIFGLRERSGWILDNIDLYNYARYAEDVRTFVMLMHTFLNPMHSFIREYVQIAKYEKNTWSLLFRAIMPIVIMTCVLVFSFSLIVPFAMHSLIEMMMLIPALYFGMVVASIYVDFKNILYDFMINHIYGGVYGCPQFKVNDRTRMAFDDDEHLAQMVHDYYIANLKECDDINNQLFKQFEQGLLGEKGLKYRNEMIERKSKLLIEWYDIHENNLLPVDQIKNMVAERLNQEGCRAYEAIRSEHRDYIDKTVDALQRHLKQSEHPITKWSLFKPKSNLELDLLKQKCEWHQKRIESVESLQHVFSTASV